MSDVHACAACGAPAEAGQGYCLECGARLKAPTRPLHWAWPAAVAAVVAAAGAAAAIAAGDNDPGTKTIVSLTTLRPASETHVSRATRLRQWPRRDGFTVVLAVIPTAAGAKAALARARAAAKARLPDVGVIDSSQYASLHPGYSVVFSGIYATLDEALAALPRAARLSRTAYAQRITR